MASTSSKAGMRIAYSCGRNRRNMTLSLSANGYTTTTSLRCDDMSVSLNGSEGGTYQQEDPCRIVRENDGGCRDQNGSESLICNPHVTDVFTLISISQMNLLKIDDLAGFVTLTSCSLHVEQDTTLPLVITLSTEQSDINVLQHTSGTCRLSLSVVVVGDICELFRGGRVRSARPHSGPIHQSFASSCFGSKIVTSHITFSLIHSVCFSQKWISTFKQSPPRTRSLPSCLTSRRSCDCTDSKL